MVGADATTGAQGKFGVLAGLADVNMTSLCYIILQLLIRPTWMASSKLFLSRACSCLSLRGSLERRVQSSSNRLDASRLGWMRDTLIRIIQKLWSICLLCYWSSLSACYFFVIFLYFDRYEIIGMLLIIIFDHILFLINFN